MHIADPSQLTNALAEFRKPDLVVHQHDYTLTTGELATLIAASGTVFSRGEPVQLTFPIEAGIPVAVPLTPERVILLAHGLARPVRVSDGGGLSPTNLPRQVGQLYLALPAHGLKPLRGITTAPLLLNDGTVRTMEGYDPTSKLWCANLPIVTIPATPTEAEARAALRYIRGTFRTFPFADAKMTFTAESPVPLLDLDAQPGQDESGFLVGLLTAICRPSLPLAPGLLVSAPSLSGAGAGKGLLVRAICAVAFGSQPYAFTASPDKAELEKRLVAGLISAEPVLFLDNVND
ncbi:MAG: hypothetical protein K2X44_01310, partial [Magnetospirillum sp.]|nr:hypothetical protein [Magnetospirillum sp.]